MSVSAPVHALRDYAFLADGERGALVDPHGEIGWMCFPRWDAAPLFGTLVGVSGRYAVGLLERYTWGGYYEDGSLIWRSRWTTAGGAVVECRTALALPADPERAILMHRVRGLHGTARVRARLEPGAGWDSHGTSSAGLEGPGVWVWREGGRHARWACGEGARIAEGAVELRFEIAEGQQRDLVLEVCAHASDDAPPPADALWEGTATAWQRSVPRLDGCAAARDARLSYAVLRGLTCAGTGGLIAACTTSLPERLDSGRLYDYRYVWIRDQAFSGQAGAALGGVPLLEDATRFVTDRILEDGSHLRPAYTLSGDPVPEERTIEAPGYPGASPIHIGNQAGSQFQLDAFGEALLLLAAAASHDVLDTRGWEAVRRAGAAVEERWQEPDAGIWELQSRWWAHSRLICAAGLQAAARSSPSREEAAGWLALADAITADAGRRALREGRWCRAADDEGNDASLLLPMIRGALPPDDPRSLATLAAVRQDLVKDGCCYRFRPGERPLGEAEGAFTLCGYWMSLAHLQMGDEAAAVGWFERSRAARGAPGLFSEEYDATQRQLRGNLPQAFVHAGFLECAARLETPG